MTATECPFCNLAAERIWVRTDSAIAFLDGFPVSPGHTLVIPDQHIGALMELPEKDLIEVWELVAHVRGLLKDKYKPNGFNIGINEGLAAGQAVGPVGPWCCASGTRRTAIAVHRWAAARNMPRSPTRRTCPDTWHSCRATAGPSFAPDR